MKSAAIAALVAAVVASGTTYAAVRINGRSIARHSIPSDRLTPGAVKSFTAKDAPAVLAAKVAGTIYDESSLIVISSPVTAATYSVACPPSYVAVSGGYKLSGAGNPATVTEDAATSDGKGWEVALHGIPAGQDLRLYAACVPVAPAK